MKAALQTALQVEGTFPGSDLANPVYIPTIPAGNTAARPAASTDYTGRWYWNTETHTIQRDTGSAWEDLTCDRDVIPSGTKMVFAEASAPTGWTQVVSGIADRLIRLATTGGVAVAGDSVASPATHNHAGATESMSIGHTHSLSPVAGLADITILLQLAVHSMSGSTGSSGSMTHTHTISDQVGFSPKYLDVIVCTKD